MLTTTKPPRCKHCKERTDRIGRLLHEECVDAWLNVQRAKKQAAEKKERIARAKVERAETRRRRAALETIPELIKAAQKEFNAYIRARDAAQACICCGKPLGEGDVGGAYDCGHYRSTGSASQLRFNEHNAHAQRKVCNRWGAGRAVDYRRGLVERLGLEVVETLESDNTPRKWTREELRSIASTYRQKLRDLQREKENA